MARPEERRQAFRNKDHSLVRISRSSGADGEISNIVDISARGLSFAYRGGISPGEELFIRLSVPQEDGTSIPLTLRGKVVWAKPIEGSSSSSLVGVNFSEDAVLPKQEIEKIIRAHWKRRASSRGFPEQNQPWHVRFLSKLFGKHH